MMKEYVEEAIEVSEEDDLLESYDKELALYDLGNHKGFLAGKHRGEKEGYVLGEKEGYSKGEKEGYFKGENDTKLDIIKRMNAEKISLDLISKVVSLDVSEIENILSNNL